MDFFCFYGGLFGKPSKNLEQSVTEGGESISFEYKLLYSSHYATSGFVELDISPGI